MGEVVPFRPKELSPEERQTLMSELSSIDIEMEPMQRRAEFIRWRLGLLAVERGLEFDDQA